MIEASDPERVAVAVSKATADTAYSLARRDVGPNRRHEAGAVEGTI